MQAVPRIHDQDDVITFAALVLCGLVAAALGSRHGPYDPTTATRR